MGLSTLGIFHTVIGVLAIIAAIIGLARDGRINLEKLSGKVYFYFTLVTSITALGLSAHGGFNPGHILSLLIIIILLFAVFLHYRRKGNTRFRYVENFALSFTFFLSMLPTVNETLTRVPVGHPVAKDPADPVIGKTLLVILLLFIIGSVAQFRVQRKINRRGVLS